MPEAKYIYRDGTTVPQGVCMVPDHWNQTFVITIRSMRHLSTEAVKEQLQKKWEVVAIDLTADTCVVNHSH